MVVDGCDVDTGMQEHYDYLKSVLTIDLKAKRVVTVAIILHFDQVEDRRSSFAPSRQESNA